LPEYGTWYPYVGTEAIALGIILLAVAALLTWLGMRLTGQVKAEKPGRTVGVFLVVIWVLSLVTFLVAVTTYGVQLYQEHLIATPPANPISPVTGLAAAATFVIIAYATRHHGWKLALGSAFVGMAAAPMIFELPFDLIVMARTFPPIPPAPSLYRLLFFLPLFLVEISTFSLLPLSPLTRLSRYTMFSLAAMFFVFAVWAFFGFGYPSDSLSILLNGLSKVLAFVAAITLFLDVRKETGPG
jgi:hypothetical protein